MKVKSTDIYNGEAMFEDFRVRETKFADASARPLTESDCSAVAELFRLNYGDTYLASDVYDGGWVKRCVYGDSAIGVAIEEDGQVAAAGALLLSLGDANDRSAELARLVVHPAHAGHGLGSRLVKALVEAAEDSLDYGESHARTAHLLSQHMLEENGFAPVGLLPGYVRGEHLVSYARIFGEAASLRQARPVRLIPEAMELAHFALSGVGLSPALDEADGPPLPIDAAYQVRTITPSGIDTLMTLRTGPPHVFGAFSLECGMTVLRNRRAGCLVAADSRGAIAGALLYQSEPNCGLARVVELIGEDPRALGFLCRRFTEIAEQNCRATILEVTVSADAPQVQRTFRHLGFRTVAYAPAMAFQDCDRRDGLKLVKLTQGWREPGSGLTKLTDRGRRTAEIVKTNWR